MRVLRLKFIFIFERYKNKIIKSNGGTLCIVKKKFIKKLKS